MKGHTEILKADRQGIARAGQLLQSGEPVVIPTETVYGLAADALNEAACRRIFEIKNRPLADPLIIHVATLEGARKLCHWNKLAARLTDVFWPGAITLVLPKKAVVPDLVTAGLPSVAIRMPSLPVSRAVLESCGCPLAAPSANPFGYVSPTCPQHVLRNLGHRIPFLLDDGPCPIGVESTIVDLRDPARPVLLRPGAVTKDMLEAEIGPVGLPKAPPSAQPDDSSPPFPKSQISDGFDVQLAPGMLNRHYSPRVKLTLYPYGWSGTGEAEDLMVQGGDQVAIVFFQKPDQPERCSPRSIYWLTESGSAAEAASRIFSLLHHLDSGSYEEILLEMAPPTGLGQAINDRLGRAAWPR